MPEMYRYIHTNAKFKGNSIYAPKKECMILIHVMSDYYSVRYKKYEWHYRSLQGLYSDWIIPENVVIANLDKKYKYSYRR